MKWATRSCRSALVTVLLAGLIVCQPDFGTATVLTLVVTTLVFSAGLSYRYLAGVAMLLLPTAILLVMGSAYRRRRLDAFLDPWGQQLGAGFQVVQSMIAVGSGGLFGPRPDGRRAERCSTSPSRTTTSSLP